MADVGVEVTLGVVPAAIEVLGVSKDGVLDRTAAAVLALYVAFQLAERVVAAQVQPVERVVADLEVHAPVAPLEVVGVLDQPKIEAPPELVLDLPGRRVGPAGVEVPELPEDPVQAHLQSLRQEIAETEISSKALADLFDKEQKGARELHKYKAEDKRYRDDITRVQATFDSLVKRLEELELVRNLGVWSAPAMGTGLAGLPVLTAGPR